jgi:hypothetical protein
MRRAQPFEVDMTLKNEWLSERMKAATAPGTPTKTGVPGSTG